MTDRNIVVKACLLDDVVSLLKQFHADVTMGRVKLHSVILSVTYFASGESYLDLGQ